MTLSQKSTARMRAVEIGGGESGVQGPLRNHHHEAYVVPLPRAADAAGAARWKCREPRSNLLWFDRRCFVSEERLLRALQGRITDVPDGRRDVADAPGGEAVPPRGPAGGR